MKLQLTKQERAALLPHIEAVLKTGEPWESPDLHHPAGAIIKAVLRIKGMKKLDTSEDDDAQTGEGFSTNGWQWDWWQEFTFKGKRYTLSGSGHHGGHSFFVADEQ